MTNNKRLLKHSSFFLPLLDEHDHGPHYLSKSILRHLKQQEEEEFSLGLPPHQETEQVSAAASAPPINGEWHRPEPMSREPTLMISLEKPQPLKEPVENSDPFHRDT